MKMCVFLIAFLFVCPSLVAYAQTSDALEMLEQAELAFQSAVDEAEISPQSADTSFAIAAAHYQRLVDEHDIQNASLFLNLGNARLLSGDVGRAIANYRRAQELAPGNQSIVAALDLARSNVGVALQPNLPDKSLAFLSNSLTAIGRSLVLIVAISCWIAAWGTCLLNRLRDGDIRMVPVPVLFAIACLGAGLLIFEEVFVTNARTGVVVWEQVDGRSGPGVGVYDETFDRPLPAGVELTIVSVRDDWIEAMLADGRVTWLPRESVEEI